MAIDIIKNQKKVYLNIANQLYGMGIYRQPQQDNDGNTVNPNAKFSLVQFNMFTKEFVKVSEQRLLNYITFQSPDLTTDPIVTKDHILDYIPELPENYQIYNRYAKLKRDVNFDFINDLNNILNSKYYLSKDYKHLDKQEREYLEQLAEEKVYFVSPKYNSTRRNMNKFENTCFKKHVGDFKFKNISLYELFGADNLRPFNISDWKYYLPNIDNVYMENLVKYHVYLDFVEENKKLIDYVNNEMGI